MADGLVVPEDVLPAILVSAQPHWEESQDWYATRAIEVLQHTFGTSGLRLCEACMAPRALVEDGAMVYQTGPVGLDEVVRLDDRTRGDARPARTGVWLDENRGGVSVRIVDLHTGRVLFAQNIDPTLVEHANTRRVYTLSEELERRARGDSLTQTFVDVALYPKQHISIDFTDQWGATNANLTGVTISVLDPVVGLGLSHYRRIDVGNVLIGAKGLVSLPTAIARSQGDESDIIDPMLTGVGVVRVPLGRTNYGVCATLSTNGVFGLGVSLLNIRLLPVLP